MKFIILFAIRFIIGFVASIALFLGYGFLVWAILTLGHHFGIVGGLALLAFAVSLILAIASFFLPKK